MKTIAIVQARMSSIRFPNKVMQPICGDPMIGLLLNRLSKSKFVDHIVLATSLNSCNTPLVEYVKSQGFKIFQGSENDVLDRYYKAACSIGANIVVRITGDCPLIDPTLVDTVIEKLCVEKVDYVSNTAPPTYPDGLDTEVFTFKSLKTAWEMATEQYHREHVTPFIRESEIFQKINISHETDYSAERWTVDEPEDFEVVRKVFEHFHPHRDFSWLDILSLCKKQPDIFAANKNFARNEGAKLGTGEKLWKRAKRVIPGGNMLLSKRAEMFLPHRWPSYFSKTKGCHVWDLDGQEYIDMSFMGIGTNILGYGNPDIDGAVYKVIENGNMSTLNCPEEVYLAEKLVELHPWADMVRLARTGGEAVTIAIRIARAASSFDKIAICGYHGWHDWYLAANLNDDQSLESHLLPGLEPKGVPQNLCGTVLPFHYNNFLELEALVCDHKIGAIIMEVSRNECPHDFFLEKVRKLATEKGIILIFDECTSGFRETFGGLHKKYGVEPDMAIFGKALGNGYAITAVIGKREVMDVAQNTFISSTFWTERIGPTAALMTLDVMEKKKSWEYITQTGHFIRKRLLEIAKKHKIPIHLYGLPALLNFTFPLPNMLKYKTLITQEMLKKNFLATTSVYVCTEHSDKEVNAYFEALDPIFTLIKQCEDGKSIDELLDGPVCHTGFKRLN